MAKSVAKILEDAADIIEKRGKCIGYMYAERVDKFCSIGAIARATYPKRVVPDSRIERIAWVHADTFNKPADYDPRFAEALHFAADEAYSRYSTGPRYDDHSAVYDYNDRETITAKHAGNMLRAAAKRARADAEKAKAKS